jgi:hypothetical protein
MKKAVAAYASNETFPAAALTNVTMGWCDCYWAVSGSRGCSGPQTDQADGWFVTTLPVYNGDKGRSVPVSDGVDGHGMYCCRPCFTSQN